MDHALTVRLSLEERLCRAYDILAEDSTETDPTRNSRSSNRCRWIIWGSSRAIRKARV